MKIFIGRIFLIAAALTLANCATYRSAKDVRLLGFEEDATKGKSIGQIEGDDCVWYVFGYALGSQPTLSRAMQNARLQRKSAVGDSFGGKNETGGKTLRYMNNVRSDNDGFNAGIVGKHCITVTGIGYM